MSGIAIVAIVVSAIFAAGVLLGATSVISLSAARRDTWWTWELPHQFRHPRDRRLAPEPEPDAEVRQDSEFPDGPPTWPDSGYRI